jgi:hypothetical protein
MFAGVQPYSPAISGTFRPSTNTICRIFGYSDLLILAMLTSLQPLRLQEQTENVVADPGRFDQPLL